MPRHALGASRDPAAVHLRHRPAQRPGQRRRLPAGQPGPDRASTDLPGPARRRRPGRGPHPRRPPGLGGRARRAARRAGCRWSCSAASRRPDAELMELLDRARRGRRARRTPTSRRAARTTSPQLHRLPLRHGAADRPRLRPAGPSARAGACWSATAAPHRRPGRSRSSTTGPTTLAGNTAFVEALCAGGRGRRRPAAADLLRLAAQRRAGPAGRRCGEADALVVTVLAAGGTKPADGRRRRRRRGLGRRRAGRAGRADPAGALPDQQPRDLGGQRRRAVPAGRRDPGRGPRVRRPDHHRAVLVQGDRRRRPAPSTWPTRSGPPGSPASRCGTPGCGTSRRRSARIVLMLSAYPTKHARIGNAVGLDTPASVVRLLRRDARARVRHRPGDGRTPSRASPRRTATR